MWGSRIPLEHAERSANLYAPVVSVGLIYCWQFGALIPMVLVSLVSLLLLEAGHYVGDMFAGETPDSFGTGTSYAIGLYFSGQFAFFDLTLFANPLFLLRVGIYLGGMTWLVVRLLRHRIGMPEFVVFCALTSFTAINIAMSLAGLAPRAIEQLLLPLAEQGDTNALVEATFLLSMFVLVVWVALHVVRAFFNLKPLLPWQIQICANEPVPGSDWKKMLLRMAGAPRNIGVSDRKLRTALLMYFANLSSLVPLVVAVGIAPAVGLALINFVKLMAGAFELKSVFDQVGKPMPFHFWLTPPYQLLLSIGSEALKAGVLLGVAYILRTRALRYVQTSLGLAQRRDPRPPVLFLRPFVMDTIPLASRPFSLLDRIYNVPVLSSTLDAVVLDEGSERGPVVAVGDPRDPPPAYGASRGYFEHHAWQDAVARLAAEAQVIVLVMGRSEGVVWEMNLVVGAGHLNKTLFVMPPDATDDDRNTALAFFERLGVKCVDRDLFSVEGSERLIAAWVDEAWRCHQLCSASGTSTSYRLALRTYFRCVRGTCHEL